MSANGSSKKKTIMRIRRPVSAAPSKPKAISLFSGAGGDTVGMEHAGYEVVAFSEFKKPAIQTHLAAFPRSNLLVHPETQSTDIKQLPTEILSPYHNQLDIVFAGFPCQGFSHAGKKRVEDPRNELVYEFSRVVEITKPKWMIGENVTGLLSRTGKDPITQEIRPVIEIIRDIFDRIGYRILYRVWKAVDHGVPQERKRLIIIGSPKERGWPSFPEEQEQKDQTLPHLRRILEDHLEGAMLFPKENIPQGLSPHYWITTSETKPTGQPHPNLIRLVNGIRNLSKKEKDLQGQQQEQQQEKTTKAERGLISFGVRKSPYHGQILDPDLPSKTIICTYGLCPRLFVGLHHVESDTYWIRCLSIRELGQIQGFPKEYPWMGKEKEIITQIGNAVPPPLSAAVMNILPRIQFHEQSPKEEQKQEKNTQEEDEDDQEDDE